MNNGKPLCIDLFCGYGGWAKGFSDAGYRVIGFDNEIKCKPHYEANGGEFVLADVRTLDGHRFSKATVIVASPPCTEFTQIKRLFAGRWGVFPHPEEGLKLVEEAARIAKEAGVPLVLENVRGAFDYINPILGNPVGRHPWYLWGDVPLLATGKWPKRAIVNVTRRRRDNHGAARAIIPYPLARALAEACKP